VQLKNETKYENMIDIMLSLHRYVPSKSVSKAVQVEESEHTIEEKQLYPLLFGEISSLLPDTEEAGLLDVPQQILLRGWKACGP